jgi:hypothetical protein
MADQDFPRYPKTKQTGDKGIRLVEKIFSDDFGWIFRSQDDQKDVGIDAHVEIAWGERVVGKKIALQIKTGESFFKRKNSEGFVFRGESKHLNYFLNYSLPVVVILCNPALDKCWWVKADSAEMEEVSKGWQITVPFSQVLDASAKEELEHIAGEVMDFGPEIFGFTVLRKHTDFYFVVIERDDIESGNIITALKLLNRVKASKKLIRRYKNKVHLSIHGYDNDSRGLCEIPEVRYWLRNLDREFPYWFYFLSKETDSLNFIIYTLCEYRIAEQGFVLDKASLARFMLKHFVAMNRMCKEAGMSANEIELLSEQVINYGKGSNK